MHRWQIKPLHAIFMQWHEVLCRHAVRPDTRGTPWQRPCMILSRLSGCAGWKRPDKMQCTTGRPSAQLVNLPAVAQAWDRQLCRVPAINYQSQTALTFDTTPPDMAVSSPCCTATTACQCSQVGAQDWLTLNVTYRCIPCRAAASAGELPWQAPRAWSAGTAPA